MRKKRSRKETKVEVQAVIGANIPDQIAGKWFPYGSVKKGTRWFYWSLLILPVVMFVVVMIATVARDSRKVEGLDFPDNYRLVTVKTDGDSRGLYSVGGSEVGEFEWEKPHVMIYDGCIGLYGPNDQYLKPTEVIDERECKLLETEWVKGDKGWSFEVVDDDGVMETADEKMLEMKDALAKAIVDVEQDYVRGAYVYDEGERGVYVWVQRAFVVGEETFEWQDFRVYQWNEKFETLNYIGSMKNRALLYIERFDV